MSAEELRAMFPLGCRVVIDVEALVLERQTQGWARPNSYRPPYTGTARGYGSPYYGPPRLWIVLDGRKSTGGHAYEARFVRRLPEPEP